ncbi:MAG: (2Fe-2S)-binding protein [Treponema sp.]|jgi:NAD(P)H-nitrite reductase large subunit|nr:(2Fe-2S)-binding protein [Treponema sp.]
MKTERVKSAVPFESRGGDDLIICRCEEITQGEIRRAIYDGLLTITELRRFLRAGCGLCQGRTCARLVKGILARELGQPAGSIADATARSPARPVEMRVLGRNLAQEDAKEGLSYA